MICFQVKESNLSPSSGHCSRSMRENCDADAGTSGTSSRSANLSNFKKQKETSVCIGNRCATNRPIATYNEKFDGSFELGNFAKYEIAKSKFEYV